MLAGVFEVITYFQVKDLKLFETHAKDWNTHQLIMYPHRSVTQ